ncbi:XRE family transcriptional regulator [Candidatus Uhrbacteria bacterium]|nr:XRE family transcriptional regulator [Candidatus Uhrbacteria bacterium]
MIQTIGNFLRSKRLEFGLTQKEVAARAGISRHTLSDIEVGRHLPRRRTLDSLKEVLGNFVVPSHLVSVAPNGYNKGVPRFTKKRAKNSLGRFVTKRRIELHLTQEQLAKRLGKCRVVITRIETGTYNNVKNLSDKLSRALECEIPSDLVA